MTRERNHDSATSNVLAWSSQSAHMQHETDDEVAAEVDEPPDDRQAAKNQFQRTTVRKHVEPSQSLLTKALHHESDDEAGPLTSGTSTSRRRSMNSNASFASTADLTSDNGLTSPARTSTPSPPPPVFQLRPLNGAIVEPKFKVTDQPTDIVDADVTPTKKSVITGSPPKDPAVEALTKKRCISFACGPKTEAKKPTSSPVPSPAPQGPAAVDALAKKRCISFACGPKTETKKPTPPPAALPAPPGPAAGEVEKPPQRKTCIKFACPAEPAPQTVPARSKEPQIQIPNIVEPVSKEKTESTPTIRKHRSSSTVRSRRSLTPRRPSQSPVAIRSTKFLIANPVELNCDSTRFHEFASNEPQEEDWIRQNPNPAPSARLTINDTLRKENEIRRLGKEAEEEALEEEGEQDDDDADADDDENGDDDDEDADDVLDHEVEEDEADDVDLDDDDDFSAYGSDDGSSAGYHTDNEIGFADSDDDDGGDLDLWTHGQASILQLSGSTPVNRRPSIPMSGNRSDSSSSGASVTQRRASREKTRRIKIRPGTPELPDSTDFVCGTLDEDRPLEDAYISCIAQKRREKLHLIPQDIDPSFPTSEPEDEDEDEGSYKAAHDSDDHVWVHGELEDLHHEHGRGERRKKRSNNNSPKRYHSPPPKLRGRSPRRGLDKHSPKRMVSPAPPLGRLFNSPPPCSPPPMMAATRGQEFCKTLATRPGLTFTKSLPRACAMFPSNLKGQRRRHAAYTGAKGHVRGAIDIVKGLEQKRQRRKEKYVQKQCNRARKGQVPEKRAVPGKGLERMREIGQTLGGKTGPGRYVLSV